MDEPRIDLSALDPRRNPERWERMVRTALAAAPRPAPHPLLAALVASWRVAVACSALAAAAAWAPALLRSTTPAAAGDASASGDPAALIASWARDGAVPADADLLQVAERGHGR